MALTSSARTIACSMAVWTVFMSGCSQESWEKISLDSVYSTNNQKGLKGLGWSDDTPHGKAFEEMISIRHGASNAFLVRGKEISEAVIEGRRIVGGFRGGSTVLIDENEKECPVWMIVFFGCGSSNPPMINIDSILRTREKIRLSYTNPKGFFAHTADVHPYYAFVPLGNLKAGDYLLELRDASANEVTLMRRVSIKARVPKNKG